MSKIFTNNKNTVLTLGFLSLIFLILLVSKNKIGTLKNVQDVNTSFAQEQKEWVSLIKRIGGQAAYDTLKLRYASDRTSIHLHAHLFGEALYQAMGSGAITVCDQDLGYGCFHGVFIKAVTTHGIGIISELDASCRNRFGPKALGCQHGIGHGVFEYVGKHHVNEALAICRKLPWKGLLGGCQSGVLMEYHFPIGSALTAVKPKQPGSNPHDPCDVIPDTFRLACIHELTFWWSALYKTDIQKMASFCFVYTNNNEHAVCFWGIGQFLYRLLHDNPDELIRYCALIPDNLDASLCRAGGRFVQVDNGRTTQDNICLSDPKTQRHCNENADLIERFAVYSN